MKYNKLIRDKIPEIIKEDDEEPITHIANDDEYAQKLKEKLEEEAKEFIEDDDIEELADILEVIYAICEFRGVDFQRVEKIRQNKKEERGGFSNKIILEEIKK